MQTWSASDLDFESVTTKMNRIKLQYTRDDFKTLSGIVAFTSFHGALMRTIRLLSHMTLIGYF